MKSLIYLATGAYKNLLRLLAVHENRSSIFCIHGGQPPGGTRFEALVSLRSTAVAVVYLALPPAWFFYQYFLWLFGVLRNLTFAFNTHEKGGRFFFIGLLGLYMTFGEREVCFNYA